MKSIWNFLRSMKFGLILLTVILILCIGGTLVTQGQDPSAYTEQYGAFWGNLIVMIGFDQLFSQWYFAGVFLLLCLNLTLCSILRFPQSLKRLSALLKRVENKQETAYVENPEEVLRGAREVRPNLWLKNRMGVLGSFVAHLGLLLLLITAALVLKTQVKDEIGIKTGKSGTLSDGSVIEVKNFSMENISGETDYVSKVLVTPAGGETTEQTISVNHPYRFGKYTIYQQSYSIDVTGVEIYTADYPEPAHLDLEGAVFLSLDDTNGIRIRKIFGDYNETEDGKLEAFNYMDGSIKRPCYEIETIENGEPSVGLALPGTLIAAGGIFCQLPQYFPVFEVKELYPAIMPLMYFSFILLIAGLYLCFFCNVTVYSVRGKQIAVAAYKDEDELFKQLEKETKKC